MWVAIDPPTPDQQPQDGLLNIRDFSIKGEPSLDRVVERRARAPRASIFPACGWNSPARPASSPSAKALVRGPTIGATIDGNIDFAKNDVRLRGTFVPLYGLNNAFGQIPIVGLFLGGSNEGLLGITYEVVGRAQRAGAARQSDLGGGAGLAAQVLRIPERHAAGRAASERLYEPGAVIRCRQTGFSQHVLFLAKR